MEFSNEYISKITDKIIEGHSLTSAVTMFEAKIDAADIDGFVKSSFYKNLEKNCHQMLLKVEDADGYRKERVENPREYLEDELEDLEYAGNILQGLALINFPDSVKAPLTKLTKSAFNGVKKAQSILSTIKDDSEILDRFKPLEYTQRALVTFAEAFKILNIPWDYDYRWENYLYDKDPKAKSNLSTKDADGNRLIDTGVPEDRQRELALIVVSADAECLENLDGVFESIEFNDSETAFVKALWSRISGKE